MLGEAGLKKGTAFIKKRLPLSFYASNEPKSVLARDPGDCRDNLRNLRSVFLYSFIRKESGMEQFLQVGVISSTHGLRGEVKVFPTTDDAARFQTLKNVVLDTGKEKLDLEIQSVRFFKQFIIVKFKGIDNINDIEKYKGKSLFVTRENAVELEEDEYYIGDLIGMEVYTDDSKERFGVLKDVMETGANEVYIITSENHGEVLLPAIHECILEIDVEAKKMKVHLMEGLL